MARLRATAGRCARLARMLAALLACAVAILCTARPAAASGGSFATAGTGTYAASLWWMDFAGYSNATAAAGGQAYTWTLPSGAGTLGATLAVSGNGTLAAVATPTWSGGGAIGHGAYNGISGSPALYWLNQPGSPVTVTLTSLVAKDAAGNARTIALYAADAENTNAGESITYTSTSPWALVDTINYYAAETGGAPSLAGAGTTTATETVTTGANTSYNGSLVLGTVNPSSVSFKLTNNEAVVVAVAIPTVSLTVNVSSRLAAADQFTAQIAYASPAAPIKSALTSGTGSSATTGATGVIGTNALTLSVSMAAGSASSIAYYTQSIACTNSGPGGLSLTGAATALPAGQGTTFGVTPVGGDAIACTITIAPQTQAVSGTVYSDTNHDAQLDNGETGAGIAGLYVKLVPSVSGACQSTATAAAAVTAATGAYTLSGVAPGSYCLVLSNSSSLSAVAAVVPAGYLATEAPGGMRTLSVGSAPPPAQNFGLYNGSTLGVTVFGDTGGGGGTANDGAMNGTEAGMSGVVVTASVSGTAIATATTGGGGTALLWLPTSAVGSSVAIGAVAPAGYAASGGSAGTTGGVYTRPVVTFTMGAGATYTGVLLGYVPPPTFAPDGAQSAAPGSTLYYAHTFVAGSAGQLSVATAATPSPAVAGWSETVYWDTGCAGTFVSGDAPASGAQPVVAGQTVCVLVREFVPATAAVGAGNKVVVTATLSYSGAAAPSPAILTRTDVTTVAATGGFTLQKLVQNLSTGGALGTSNSALPGQTLQYQLLVMNQGTGPASTVIVNDATPAYTTFVSAACPVAPLPAGLTGCIVSAQPATGGQGALQWTFSGTLAPGAQAAVTYQVQVAP